MSRLEREGLQVHPDLYSFLAEELLPDSGVEETAFWQGLSSLLHNRAPENAQLLRRRQQLQDQLDAWDRDHQGSARDLGEYRTFLEEIGYLHAEKAEGTITTEGVDLEVALIAAPQLIVPVTNARYALNAANARWGSLYDALYGTDAISAPAAQGGPYDPERGAQVIAWARQFLDDVVPLDGGSHADAVAYQVIDGQLVVTIEVGDTCRLATSEVFKGYVGEPSAPSSILLCHNGLHVELVIDRGHEVGSTDRAGIADVMLEAAATVIADCEDSVAAVDASDKALVYRNWLGLMKGDLVETFTKSGHSMTRSLADDRAFLATDGSLFSLPGRALLMVRTVGHLMTTDAILDRHGNEVPEGLLDAVVTVLAAMHNFKRDNAERNSRHGSVYVVKPKMHGPEEVAFAGRVFTDVERMLGLPANTVKIGLMDEERRTSLNLAQCITAAKERIAFINTGFLDRTGDEIHSSMEAGVAVPKAQMKSQQWLTTYEDRNVDTGLALGFRGRAQIGKGMWAAPDRMAQMLAEKGGQLEAGASCGWVPSPTAAVLHATHYHRIDVSARQAEIKDRVQKPRDDMLVVPIQQDPSMDEAEIADELSNNAQGILGYVVRWIDQGIGCSKVPDIHDVALMEDRATCRISSQHIANWLHHGVVDREQVMDTMREMAVKVDGQNAGDSEYTPMAPHFDGVAFQAACDLVFMGKEQPSGYTEPILHARRRERKQAIGGQS
jgi:malate synthase